MDSITTFDKRILYIVLISKPPFFYSIYSIPSPLTGPSLSPKCVCVCVTHTWNLGSHIRENTVFVFLTCYHDGLQFVHFAFFFQADYPSTVNLLDSIQHWRQRQHGVPGCYAILAALYGESLEEDNLSVSSRDAGSFPPRYLVESVDVELVDWLRSLFVWVYCELSAP